MAFQVSKMGLTTCLTQLVSILRAKLQKVIIWEKYCVFFFNFWLLLLKLCIFEDVKFFSYLAAGSINSIFQGQYVFIRFILMKRFFLLTIRMSMVTKLFRVATCCEELSPINMHDISTEWSCEVT